MPASVCRDCSVCYVRYEASPERIDVSGTAGGRHPTGKGDRLGVPAAVGLPL